MIHGTLISNQLSRLYLQNGVPPRPLVWLDHVWSSLIIKVSLERIVNFAGVEISHGHIPPGPDVIGFVSLRLHTVALPGVSPPPGLSPSSSGSWSPSPSRCTFYPHASLSAGSLSASGSLHRSASGHVCLRNRTAVRQ